MNDDAVRFSHLDAAQRSMLETERAAHEAARKLLPGVDEPYFARLRIDANGRTTDVLLGTVSRPSRGTAIVDWQAAPLAEVFFAFSEGERYELELEEGDEGRKLVGTVLERSIVAFEKGELVAVKRPGLELVREPDGTWRVHAVPEATVPPRSEAARRKSASPVEVELDAAQKRVVELPRGRHVLVLGEAGYGKTTVGLHRLARLKKAHEKAKAAVIVPTEGLRRLTEVMLERLDVRGVDVRIYDTWAGDQARRAFQKIPGRESADASAGVIRLKRHPALRTVLGKVRPPAPGSKPKPPTRNDLLHLFGDSALMDPLVEASGGAITKTAVAETLEHTKVQFSKSTEDAHRHVDSEQLKTADGLSIDERTAMNDAGTIDTEDYAVLFELDRVRAREHGGQAVRPRAYDILLVDEAQELAPLELALIGRSIAPAGSLIVAGDAGQQVDATASFEGWDAVVRELEVGPVERTTLEVSYRCPPEVTTAARRILDRATDAPLLQGGAAPRDRAAVSFQTFAHECDLVASLTDELREIAATDPNATVALICRTPAMATRFARLLNRGTRVRLVLSGDFDFRSGVSVTAVQEVKGLEFDVVIVPDASPAMYPDTADARRALYVAVTRATHHLMLAAAGRLSPIVQPLVGG